MLNLRRNFGFRIFSCFIQQQFVFKNLNICLLQIILSLDRYLYRISNRPLYMIVNSAVFITGTVGIKLTISHLMHVEDDVSFLLLFSCNSELCWKESDLEKVFAFLFSVRFYEEKRCFQIGTCIVSGPYNGSSSCQIYIICEFSYTFVHMR